LVIYEYKICVDLIVFYVEYFNRGQLVTYGESRVLM